MRPVPALEVLICTARRPTWLEALLRALADDPSRPSTGVGVVVVDNDPAASAASVLDAPWPFPIRTAHLAQPDIVGARNLAFALSEAPLLLLLDDDQLVAPGFFAALDTAWRARPHFAVGLRLGVVPRPEPGADPRYFAAPTPRVTPPHPVTRTEFATNGLLIERAALAALGAAPFDPRFGLTGGEDTELFLRLDRRGLRVAASSLAVTERVPRDRATLRHVLRGGLRTGYTDALIALREGQTRPAFAAELIAALALRASLAAASLALGARPGTSDLVSLARLAGKTLALSGLRWQPYRPREATR